MTSAVFPIELLRKRAGHALFLLALIIVSLLGLLIAPKALWADEPTIIYDGAARSLKVEGASDANDLFGNFKDLMPGDSRDQVVQIKAKGVKGKVRLFVKATTDEQMARELDAIALKAEAKKDSSDAAVGAGSVGRVFAEATKIVEFSAGGTAVLDLHLSVPEEVDNELADTCRTVRWEITAEDDEGSIKASVGGQAAKGGALIRNAFGLAKTGDNALGVAFAVFVLGCSVVALAVALVRRRGARS